MPRLKIATMELLCLRLCREGHGAEGPKTRVQQHSSHLQPSAETIQFLLQGH